MAKKTQTVYNVSFYTLTNKFIDQTQIDEKSDELAWELFAEFGHTKEAGMYLDWEEEEEEMDED
jgi:chromosome segregation and condensation protein ScpB